MKLRIDGVQVPLSEEESAHGDKLIWLGCGLCLCTACLSWCPMYCWCTRMAKKYKSEMSGGASQRPPENNPAVYNFATATGTSNGTSNFTQQQNAGASGGFYGYPPATQSMGYYPPPQQHSPAQPTQQYPGGGIYGQPHTGASQTMYSPSTATTGAPSGQTNIYASQ